MKNILFLLILTISFLDAKKWNQTTIIQATNILSRLSPLINNQSFKDAVSPYLSLRTNRDVFGELNITVNRFISRTYLELTKERKKELLRNLDSLLEQFLSLHNIVRAYYTFLCTNHIRVPQEEELSAPQEIIQITFLEFWQDFENAIEQLKDINNKATRSKKCTIM